MFSSLPNYVIAERKRQKAIEFDKYKGYFPIKASLSALTDKKFMPLVAPSEGGPVKKKGLWDWGPKGGQEDTITGEQIYGSWNDATKRDFIKYVYETSGETNKKKANETTQNVASDANAAIVLSRFEMVRKFLHVDLSGPENLEDWILLYLVKKRNIQFPRAIDILIQKNPDYDPLDERPGDYWGQNLYTSLVERVVQGTQRIVRETANSVRENVQAVDSMARENVPGYAEIGDLGGYVTRATRAVTSTAMTGAGYATRAALGTVRIVSSPFLYLANTQIGRYFITTGTVSAVATSYPFFTAEAVARTVITVRGSATAMGVGVGMVSTAALGPAGGVVGFWTTGIGIGTDFFLLGSRNLFALFPENVFLNYVVETLNTVTPRFLTPVTLVEISANASYYFNNLYYGALENVYMYLTGIGDVNALREAAFRLYRIPVNGIRELAAVDDLAPFFQENIEWINRNIDLVPQFNENNLASIFNAVQPTTEWGRDFLNAVREFTPNATGQFPLQATVEQMRNWQNIITNYNRTTGRYNPVELLDEFGELVNRTGRVTQRDIEIDRFLRSDGLINNDVRMFNMTNIRGPLLRMYDNGTLVAREGLEVVYDGTNYLENGIANELVPIYERIANFEAPITPEEFTYFLSLASVSIPVIITALYLLRAMNTRARYQDIQVRIRHDNYQTRNREYDWPLETYLNPFSYLYYFGYLFGFRR